MLLFYSQVPLQPLQTAKKDDIDGGSVLPVNIGKIFLPKNYRTSSLVNCGYRIVYNTSFDQLYKSFSLHLYSQWFHKHQYEQNGIWFK